MWYLITDKKKTAINAQPNTKDKQSCFSPISCVVVYHSDVIVCRTSQSIIHTRTHTHADRVLICHHVKRTVFFDSSYIPPKFIVGSSSPQFFFFFLVISAAHDWPCSCVLISPLITFPYKNWWDESYEFYKTNSSKNII